MQESKIIALVSNSAESLLRFRGSLINALVQANYVVFAVAPSGPQDQEFNRLGAHFLEWKLNRKSLSILSEFRSLYQLWKIYKQIRPTVVQHYTIKPNIYGAIAGRLAGIPILIGTVTGLGEVFVKKGCIHRPIIRLIATLYRVASSLSTIMLFQNTGDIAFLDQIGAVPKSKALLMPGGSGINLSIYAPSATNTKTLIKLRKDLKISGNATNVMMIGRMLWSKGVREYVHAAAILKQHSSAYTFLLVGPIDMGSRAAIPHSIIKDWVTSGWIQYLGRRNDIRDLIALADLIVLPSYGEGMSRTLIEAAAMGKPIIATDVNGCKEIVDNDINGILIPTRDPFSLAEAIKKLIGDKTLMRRFGVASREKALAEFDEQKVASRHLELYQRLLGNLAGYKRQQGS